MATSTPTTNDGSPVYLHIARILETEIRRAYRAGEMLPSEQSLAVSYGVNRHTLRRAVDELVDAGLVERRRGHGTRVIDPAICYPISSSTRFSENLNAMGHASEVRLVFNREAAATSGVAQGLGLSEGASVVWIEVLRLADNQPFSVASHFFPQPQFSELLQSYQGGSLHAHLAEHYQLQPQRLQSLISAVMPRSEDAHLLKTPYNKPLLRTKSINIDPATRRSVEYCVTRARSDRCQIEVCPHDS